MKKHVQHNKTVFINGEKFQFSLNWYFTDHPTGRGGNGATFGPADNCAEAWSKLIESMPTEKEEDLVDMIADEKIGFDSSMIFDRNLNEEQMTSAIERSWRKIANKRIKITI